MSHPHRRPATRSSSPTLVLLGSFLVPVTFVAWAFERRETGEITAGVLLSTFITGGILGVLAASVARGVRNAEPDASRIKVQVDGERIILTRTVRSWVENTRRNGSPGPPRRDHGRQPHRRTAMTALAPRRGTAS
jgi:hypothetical protein